MSSGDAAYVCCHGNKNNAETRGTDLLTKSLTRPVSLAVYATSLASVAQLAERHLPKVDVEGSNPFARSIAMKFYGCAVKILPQNR